LLKNIAKFDVGGKMNKMISGVVLMSLLLWISACGGSTTPSNPTVEQITVISTKAGNIPDFQIGETDQFKATAVYSDSSVKDVTASTAWSSTDTNIATVNSTGLVTAVAAGTVSILAAFSGRSASLMIRVLPNP
jgi:hypothetical protein